MVFAVRYSDGGEADVGSEEAEHDEDAWATEVSVVRDDCGRLFGLVPAKGFLIRMAAVYCWRSCRARMKRDSWSTRTGWQKVLGRRFMDQPPDECRREAWAESGGRWCDAQGCWPYTSQKV